MSAEIERLDPNEAKWRLVKLKQILGIKKSGPFIYNYDKKFTPSKIGYNNIYELLPKPIKGSIYIHYHQAGIVAVQPNMFRSYWGNGQFYPMKVLC